MYKFSEKTPQPLDQCSDETCLLYTSDAADE